MRLTASWLISCGECDLNGLILVNSGSIGFSTLGAIVSILSSTIGVALGTFSHRDRLHACPFRVGILYFTITGVDS